MVGEEGQFLGACELAAPPGRSKGWLAALGQRHPLVGVEGPGARLCEDLEQAAKAVALGHSELVQISRLEKTERTGTQRPTGHPEATAERPARARVLVRDAAHGRDVRIR